jgi:hypothetical protein
MGNYGYNNMMGMYGGGFGAGMYSPYNMGLMTIPGFSNPVQGREGELNLHESKLNGIANGIPTGALAGAGLALAIGAGLLTGGIAFGLAALTGAVVGGAMGGYSGGKLAEAEYAERDFHDDHQVNASTGAVEASLFGEHLDDVYI